MNILQPKIYRQCSVYNVDSATCLVVYQTHQVMQRFDSGFKSLFHIIGFRVGGCQWFLCIFWPCPEQAWQNFS